MAKYSIILPVRNGGHYVKICVDSILAQTYTDFNFIVLDNCSTDGTLEWLLSLNDSRIQVIPSQKSLSIEENWGRIKAVEKNEFITLIGHDDILYPDFLQVIDRLVKSNPDASLYHTHFNFIDANNNTIRTCKPMNKIITGYEFLSLFLARTIDSMGTGYVMRSKDYDTLNGIPVRYPNLLFADFELWLNLTFISYEVIAPENCFAFRVHQSTTGKSPDKKLHEALEIFVDFLSSLKQQNPQVENIVDQYGSEFLVFYCKGLSHRLLRTPIQKRENLSVRDFIDFTKKLALKLGIQNQYKPEQVKSIRLAEIIDNNKIFRQLFLLFKSIYSTPISK